MKSLIYIVMDLFIYVIGYFIFYVAFPVWFYWFDMILNLILYFSCCLFIYILK